MATFPTLTISASSKFEDEYIKPTVKTKFEGNYSQSRPKYTRASHNFNTLYNMITETDKATLQTFFNTNSGNSFTWNNPTDEVDYTVIFAEDSLSFKNITLGFYEVNIKLEEL